jgi:hypothetical protein
VTTSHLVGGKKVFNKQLPVFIRHDHESRQCHVATVVHLRIVDLEGLGTGEYVINVYHLNIMAIKQFR